MKKKNKFKLDNTMKVGIGIMVALLLFAGISSVKAEWSLTDKIAQVAGQILGKDLASKINLTVSDDSLGAFPGSKVYNEVRFYDDLVIDHSPDGFVAYIGVIVATTTSSGSYTNDTGKLICDSNSAFLHWQTTAGATTSYLPALVFSVGTTTSTNGLSAATYGIFASTTQATTSAAVNYVKPATDTSLFILDRGESIVMDMADHDLALASSTHYTNLDAEFGVHCWKMGK